LLEGIYFFFQKFTLILWFKKFGEIFQNFIPFFEFTLKEKEIPNFFVTTMQKFDNKKMLDNARNVNKRSHIQ
jgi:hypothetical protein